MIKHRKKEEKKKMKGNKGQLENYSVGVGPNQGYIVEGGNTLAGQPDYVRCGANEYGGLISFISGKEYFRPSDFKEFEGLREEVRFQENNGFLDNSRLNGFSFDEGQNGFVGQIRNAKLTDQELNYLAQSIEGKSTRSDYFFLSLCDQAQLWDAGRIVGHVETLKFPKQLEEAYKVAVFGNSLFRCGIENLADAISAIPTEDLAQRAVNYGFRSALQCRRFGDKLYGEALMSSEISDLIHPVHKEVSLEILTPEPGRSL